MPCDTKARTPSQKQLMAEAIDRLAQALGNPSSGVRLVIGAQGSVSFKGWQDNEGVADLCAYRRLLASNSPALRRAVARAEVMSGRKLDQRAISTGLHSHDGGATWSQH